MLRRFFRLATIAILFIATHAYSLTASEANAIASGESDARIAALNSAVAQADDKTAAFLQALSDDAVKLVAGKAIMMTMTKGTMVQTISTTTDSWKVAGLCPTDLRCFQME